MTKMRSIYAGAFIGAVAGMTLVGSTAFAQIPNAPTPGSPTPGASGKNEAAVEARAEAQIKQLHADLKITPAEEAQWKDFADVIRNNAHDMERATEQVSQQAGSMTALQHLQSYAEFAEARVDHLKKLASAFAPLYNAMPADQKQVADKLFRGPAGTQPHAGSGARPPQ